MKLCEETNQLIKEMLQKVTEQTRLINELVTFPRELKKQLNDYLILYIWYAKIRS
jgi:hypothetical protein